MNPNPMDRFEASWKAHASRPPATPADRAARQVLQRIESERRETRRPIRHLFAVAAGLLLAVGLAWQLRAPGRMPETVAAGVTSDTATVTAALETDVVLFWLDSETPLYMTMRPSRGETP